MTAPLDVRLPSMDGLRAFEAAARLGTFEKAADELAVTASAIGKRIAAIEEMIGSPIFARTGRALALTASGREYLEQVRSALALLSAMPQHRRRATGRERLRVIAPPTFSRQVIIPELASFTSDHPWVDLEFGLSLPYVGEPGADADVEICHGGSQEALGGRPLMDDVLVPLAAPALFERHPQLRTPAGLSELPLLRTPIDPWAPWFRAAGLDWPEPDTGPKLIDLGLLLEAAAAGLGVALARPSLARAWLRDGRLRAPFDLRVPAAGCYQLLPHARSSAADAFDAWLAGTCERAALAGLDLISGQR